MPLAGSDILLYEKQEHIVTITLNRSERLNEAGIKFQMK
jgi:enoyl-CoA hydratase/carnithine racemase